MEIKQLILETAAPGKLFSFYGQLMGLPTEYKDGNTIQVRIGKTELVFKTSDLTDPFYHFAINIPANKIFEARQWAAERVELIIMEDYHSDIADFVNWHARSIYFYDPAGNIVELIARFDLKNDEPGPFNAKQWLSISEAGIVFPGEELDQNTEKLLQQYSLNYFDKQPPLPQFRAVGDDQGLFIIVPDKRNWYPTKKPSGIFPMHLQFDNKGRNYSLSM
jgi:hypothetical protein